jgi:hypothetical protein
MHVRRLGAAGVLCGIGMFGVGSLAPLAVAHGDDAKPRANAKATVKASGEAKAQSPAVAPKAQPVQLAKLVGEWDGQIQFRSDDGTVNATPIGATMKQEKDGSIAACFSGVLQGKPFDASCIWTVQEGNVRVAWIDSKTNRTCKASGAGASSGGDGLTIVLSGDVPSIFASGELRQSVTLASDSRLVVEWTHVDANNKRTRLVTIDMDRLSDGQESAASSGYAESTQLAKLREVVVAQQGEE